MCCFFCFPMILFLLVALPLLMLSHRRLSWLKKSHIRATLLLLSVAAGDIVWISLSHWMNDIGSAPASHTGQLPCSRGPLWDQTRCLGNLSICILKTYMVWGSSISLSNLIHFWLYFKFLPVEIKTKKL